MSLLLANATVRGDRTSILVEDGKIAAHDDSLQAEERIDLDGAEVVPGFVDTHTHLGWAGAALWRVDWAKTRTREEALAEVRRARSRMADGYWLLGGGWSSPADLPTQAELDEASGGAPAYLISEDQSLALANSEAARLFHLDELMIESEEGWLRGTAARAMSTAGAIPPLDRHRRRAELATALAELPRHGIVEAHDIATFPGEPEPPLLYWERSYTDATLFDELELPVRIGVRPSLHRRHEFRGDERIQGLKLFSMGGSGRRAGGVTFRYPGRETAIAWIREVHEAGVAVSVHSLRAHDVAETIAIFEGVPDVQDVRHRLVHAYEIAEGDVERIARLGLTVEAQPWDTVEEVGTAPWRALLDAGVSVEFGSDWRGAALEPLDPLLGVGIAVEQGLTRTEALACYSRGSLDPGGSADLVAIVDETDVVLTVANGRVVYAA